MTLALAILGVIFGLSSLVISIYNLITNIGIKSSLHEPVAWTPARSVDNARAITDGDAPEESAQTVFDTITPAYGHDLDSEIGF